MRQALLTEARILAAQVNDPAFAGDRWSVSMRLSQIQKQLGAQGVDRSADESANDEECE